VSQLGQRLPHGTNGVAHRSTAYLSLIGSNVALSVSMPKHLEERDWVGVLAQGGVNMMFLAESFPDGKCVVGSCPLGMADPQWEGTRNSDEVSLEARFAVIGASCHGGVTGKRLLSSRRKSWSLRWNAREQKSAMVLEEPGTDTTCSEQLSDRLSWARYRRRWAFAPMEEGEPLVHQETAGVLSDAMYSVAAVVLALA